jgi:hypothetical protein
MVRTQSCEECAYDNRQHHTCVETVDDWNTEQPTCILYTVYNFSLHPPNLSETLICEQPWLYIGER